jgi:hypothetical protein
VKNEIVVYSETAEVGIMIVVTSLLRSKPPAQDTAALLGANTGRKLALWPVYVGHPLKCFAGAFASSLRLTKSFLGSDEFSAPVA